MANPNRDDGKEPNSSHHDQPAGERRRDDERDGHGPVYKGGDWSKADQEGDRGEALDLPAEEEVRSDTERADEEIEDPGTRGAVFGRGGVGIVERDEDKPAKPNPKNS
jgi:hypothetical protein